jgi:hypothetical protein
MWCNLWLSVINVPEIGSIPYQSNAARAETRRNEGAVSIVVASETG